MFNMKRLKNMTLRHCTRTSNRNDHYHNIFKHIDYVTLLSFLITNKVSLLMPFNTLNIQCMNLRHCLHNVSWRMAKDSIQSMRSMSASLSEKAGGT